MSARICRHLLPVLALGGGLLGSLLPAAPIDREAVVRRHGPEVQAVDPWSPFSLGNGRFAFTADVTGLQTFPDAYTDGIPLSTQSEWGWHSFPNTEGHTLAATMEDYATGDRQVPYPTLQHTPAGQFLRANPHRLGLGRLGLILRTRDGREATVEAIEGIDQHLDLWRGELVSRFTWNGEPVRVRTLVHPEQDVIAVSVESPLVASGELGLRLRFAYGSGAWGIEPEDWTRPDAHTTTLAVDDAGRRLRWERTLDADGYRVEGAGSRDLRVENPDAHDFLLWPETTAGSSPPHVFSFSLAFIPRGEVSAALPDFEAAQEATHRAWAAFWQSGAAIDFAGSTDPRAPELERRIILSQYLTRIQTAGTQPPQESGLTFNTWYGKPHLEMHWWHGVHYALWGRLPLLERSLPWYDTILPEAREIARSQGYPGARWPKMVGPTGGRGPSTIAPLLIWQQPHPLYFAELVRRADPSQETLARFREMVRETADFMAGYASWNPATEVYDLGPPVIPAQESFDPRTTRNPPLELAYWAWGLGVAERWFEALGEEPPAAWAEVRTRLAPLPVTTSDEGTIYAASEAGWNPVDHPSVLAPLGMLPGEGVDRERMRRTLRKVLAEWEWNNTWGWDYPLIALTAARLGEPELALDALFLDVPKNRYLKNGHNYQEDALLRLYLPGNGGLLTAIALMAGGWDGAPDTPNPGFPAEGWNVRAEGFVRMP